MKIWIGVLAPVLLVLGLVGWRVSAEKASAEQVKQQQKSRGGNSPVVEVAVAEPATIIEEIQVIGTLESPFVAQLSPKVVGRIDSIAVREGDSVQAGQVLVNINSNEIDGQMLQQKASVSEAESRLAQAEINTSANSTSVQSALRIQKATLDSALAEQRQAERSSEAQVSAAEAQVQDSKAKVSVAESEVRQREAELRAAETTAKNAREKSRRLETLLAKGFISGQQVDDARTLAEAAEANVSVKQNEVAGALEAVKSAKATQISVEKQLSVVRERGIADVAAAKARVEQARANLAGAEANLSQTAAYQQNLKALRSSVDAAKAGLSQSQSRLSETALVAPFTGTVTARTADPGSLASPGQSILTVQFLGWLFVNASVSAEYSSQLRLGQPASVEIDGLPGKTFDGKIESINRSADSQSRQFGVKIRLDNANEELRPGMFANLKIPIKTTQARVAVPLSAVTKGKDGSSVVVLDADGVATRKTVVTGESNSKFVEVMSGLSPGDRVVTLSYSPVKDGQKVKLEGEGEEKKGS